MEESRYSIKRSSNLSEFPYSHYEAALKSLIKLHIVLHSKDKLTLHAPFKTGLRDGLTGRFGFPSFFFRFYTDVICTPSSAIESFGVPVIDQGSSSLLSAEMLDVYALERWDVSYIIFSGIYLLNLTCRLFYITWSLQEPTKRQQSPQKAFCINWSTVDL